MPISHTCPSCCRELGHIRAIPDPHYALGVVVCPRCANATVRTRHPDRVYWQHVRRLRKSLQQLVLAFIFTALVTGATIGMSYWINPEITARPARYIPPDLSDPAIPFQLGIAGFLIILCGCIARTIYAHLRFYQVLVMFLLLIGFFLNIDWLVARLMQYISTLFGAGADIRMASANEITRRTMSTVLLLPSFLVGMFVGTVCNRMIEKSASRRTVRIRRRLRKRRSRLD